MSLDMSRDFGMHGWYSWGLTFDMSGRIKAAKQALVCPLDGRVGRLPLEAG